MEAALVVDRVVAPPVDSAREAEGVNGRTRSVEHARARRTKSSEVPVVGSRPSACSTV
jgi:hypothetical protein